MPGGLMGGGSSGSASGAYSGMASAAQYGGAVNAQDLLNAAALSTNMYTNAQNAITGGTKSAIAAGAPYNAAGLSALDLYQQSLGMPTISSQYGGSLGLQTALGNKTALDQYNQQQALNTNSLNSALAGYVGQRYQGGTVAGTPTGMPAENFATWQAQHPGTIEQQAQTALQDIGAISANAGGGAYAQSFASYAPQIQQYLTALQNQGASPAQLTDAQNQLVSAYQGGNLTGVETAANPQTVLNAFQTANPGYNFALNQGIQGVSNNASAAGLLGSGAMARDIAQYAGNYANQQYGNWQNQLYQMTNLGSQFSPANLYQQQGQNLAGLYGNQANSGMNLYSALGSNAANSLLSSANASALGGISSANVNSANAAAMGKLGSTLGSSLSSMFGGGTSAQAASGAAGGLLASFL